MLLVAPFATGPSETEMTPDMMIHLFKKFATENGFDYNSLVGTEDVSDDELRKLEEAADQSVSEAMSCSCFKWFVASQHC
jgi:hypothetical protein